MTLEEEAGSEVEVVMVTVAEKDAGRLTELE